MPKISKDRKSFSRVGKLLDLFGYGASSPYNAPTIRNNKGLSQVGGMSANSFQSWYANQIQDSEDFNSLLGDWKEMVSYSPVAAAVRIIVEEAIQTEHSAPATLWAEGGDTETEEMINDLIVNNLEMEDVIRTQIWWVVSYGNNMEKLIIGPEGVYGWRKVNVEDVERIVDEDRRIIGFKYSKEQPPGEDSPLYGVGDQQEKLWKMWDFIHMRLMSENRDSEYGTSLLNPAVHVFKRLRMAEDQMVSYRLQMQPTRYLFKIDTGTNPIDDVAEIVNEWSNYLRSNRSMDSQQNKYEHRYNPWSLDDIIIFPIRKESQSDVTKLDGDSDIPDITDVRYLMRMLAGMLNVPPEFLGIESEGGSSLTSKSSLAVQDLRFQRSIKSIRAPVMQGYDRAARIHLALQNKDPYVPFRIRMSNISALESESQMELVSNQADLADKLIALGDNINAPKEEWIKMVFTKFMPLPDELVDLVTIGAMMNNGESSDMDPLPSGPDIDSEMDMDAEPDFSSASSGDDFDALESIYQKRKERRKKIENQKLHECLRNPKAAIKYYEKTYSSSFDNGLMESSTSKPLNESLLTETRQLIEESLTECQSKLADNKSIRRKVYNIIRLTEGYSADFLLMDNLKDYAERSCNVLTEEQRKKGSQITLAESMVPTDEHEFVGSLKRARGSKSSDDNK